MEHDLELIIARLEILEIEVYNILQNPGNIGKRIFSTSSYPGNIGKRICSLSPILEIVDRTIQYFSSILEILDRTIHICSYVDVAGGRGGSPGVGGGHGNGGGDGDGDGADPWTITPRDQISRSGSIPHFDNQTNAYIS